MGSIKNRLQEAMDSAGLNQNELSRKTGINKGSINCYLKGRYTPKQNNIFLLSKALNVSEGWLMGLDVDRVRTNSKEFVVPHQDGISKYPYIEDSVAAGIPTTIAGTKKLPTIVFPDAIMGKYAGSRKILIMKVNGDSMNRVIPNGSFIAVKTDVGLGGVKNKDIVVFRRNHEYSVKRFLQKDDMLIFAPDSTDPTFFSHGYPKDTDDEIEIIGKVVLYIVSNQ